MKSISISSLKGFDAERTQLLSAYGWISTSSSESSEDKAKTTLHYCFEASSTSMTLPVYCSETWPPIYHALPLTFERSKHSPHSSSGHLNPYQFAMLEISRLVQVRQLGTAHASWRFERNCSTGQHRRKQTLQCTMPSASLMIQFNLLQFLSRRKSNRRSCSCFQ